MDDFYAKRVQEQNEDLKTDGVRDDIKVNLTDKEYSNLKLMAYKAGFDSAGKFLSSFVGDLTGWHSNGSDERDLADQWFERAFGSREWYSHFRYHLYNNDFGIDEMKDMIEDEDWFEETYQEYLEENTGKTNQTKEECLALLKELVEKGEEL